VKPIIFNTDMVKAILEGRKTQTRRVIMPQPHIERGVMRWQKSHKGGMHGIDLNMDDHADIAVMFCPYGQVGDKLWCRETFAEPFGKGMGVIYRADYEDGNLHTWRPSIHMPRWASRITLEITEIRVEMLQEITINDCKNEGIKDHVKWIGKECYSDAVIQFQELWDSINGKKHPWLSNPWVWAVSFKMLKDKDKGR